MPPPCLVPLRKDDTIFSFACKIALRPTFLPLPTERERERDKKKSESEGDIEREGERHREREREREREAERKRKRERERDRDRDRDRESVIIAANNHYEGNYGSNLGEQVWAHHLQNWGKNCILTDVRTNLLTLHTVPLPLSTACRLRHTLRGPSLFQKRRAFDVEASLLMAGFSPVVEAARTLHLA